MDFITRKALGAKLKNVGQDLGLSDLAGSSSDRQNNTWSIFDADSQPQSDQRSVHPSDDDLFPLPVANFFDNMPNNFPPVLHLFYIDFAILSLAATRPMKLVRWVLRLSTFAISLNVTVSILMTAFVTKGEWLSILFSVVVGVFAIIFQLIAYDTAFRGAYRTNKQLRIRYCALVAVNIVLALVYAVAGVSFLHGWARISALRGAPSASEGGDDATVHNVHVGYALCAAEAALWTGLVVLSATCLYRYFGLLQDGGAGLSRSALSEARAGGASDRAAQGPARAESAEAGSSAARSGVDARVEAIRNKYQQTGAGASAV